jgi:DNA-binding CsgD family transcriptional regulator
MGESVMNVDAGLDPGMLTRLRKMVQSLHEANGRGVPLEQLVDLATEVRLDAGVTIDFEASIDIGQPFVVLRVPTRVEADTCLNVLSRREREVAVLVAEGLSNKKIAQRLSISLATVKDHVHSTLRKTGLPNRAAIAAACRGPVER